MRLSKQTNIETQSIAYYIFAGCLMFLGLFSGCNQEQQLQITNEPSITLTTQATPIRTLAPTNPQLAEPTVATSVENPPITITPTLMPTTTPLILSPTPEFTPNNPLWQIKDRTGALLFGAILQNNEHHIYLANNDGSYEFISYGALIAGQPWSPDRTKLIVATGKFSQNNPPGPLVIVDLITGINIDLHIESSPSAVYWSPDGSHILYKVSKPGSTFSGQLALYDIANQSTTIITEPSAIISIAGWSSDGQKIAFVSDINGTFDLYIMELETQTTYQVTNDNAIEAQATWSPIGDQLIYGTLFTDDIPPVFWPYQVYKLYLTQGSDFTPSLIGDDFYEMITWSQEGEYIAFVGRGTCTLELSTKLEVCYPSKDEHLPTSLFPAWSPDERKLAFRATGPERCYPIQILDLESNIITDIDIDQCIVGPGPLYWLP